MAISQHQAVVVSTLGVLKEANVSFTPGETVIHDVITKEIRNLIVDRVFNMFRSGEVSLKDTYSNSNKLTNPKELRRYVVSLVTNWHNKDRTLSTYVERKNKDLEKQIEEDSLLKDLLILRKEVESEGNTEDLAKVDEAIENRRSYLRETYTDSKPIDINDIPVDLRYHFEED